MKKIIFVRSTAVNPESRLEKEVDTLVKNNYRITVLGWNRKGDSPMSEKKDGYSIIRMGIKAPVGKKVVFYWPIWWVWVFLQLMKLDYDYIHAADFDSYLPSVFAAKIRRKPIIYDIYDFYPDLIALPKLIDILFLNLDLALLKLADRVIIVDECRLKQIHQEDNKAIEIIYNTPNDEVISTNSFNHDSDLKVFYGGTIYPERDLMLMLQIACEVQGVNVEIAGMGDPKLIETIKEFCSKSDNISFIGKLPYSEILLHTMRADILFALYDPTNLNNKLASPNKLFEAMMCKKPIIMNTGIACADIIQNENMGLLVPYGDYDALKKAVLTLKNNPALRKELGENGRKAYDTKYNWKIMEKRLLDMYSSLEKQQ